MRAAHGEGWGAEMRAANGEGRGAGEQGKMIGMLYKCDISLGTNVHLPLYTLTRTAPRTIICTSLSLTSLSTSEEGKSATTAAASLLSRKVVKAGPSEIR